jgi:hypothetical protein
MSASAERALPFILLSRVTGEEKDDDGPGCIPAGSAGPTVSTWSRALS